MSVKKKIYENPVLAYKRSGEIIIQGNVTVCPFMLSLLADIIYVGVLHIIHRDVVLMYLEHRKNVICEKPLAMNSTEVKELIAAARKYKVFFMEVL